MAKVYYFLILKGRITIDEVPQRWKPAVEEMLSKA